MNAREAWAERDKLRAEGNKLWAEGKKLWAESDIIFLAAVITEFGNVAIEWRDWNEKHGSSCCRLGNGEYFGFDD